jgi:hypothetical protein
VKFLDKLRVYKLLKEGHWVSQLVTWSGNAVPSHLETQRTRVLRPARFVSSWQRTSLTTQLSTISHKLKFVYFQPCEGTTISYSWVYWILSESKIHRTPKNPLLISAFGTVGSITLSVTGKSNLMKNVALDGGDSLLIRITGETMISESQTHDKRSPSASVSWKPRTMDRRWYYYDVRCVHNSASRTLFWTW